MNNDGTITINLTPDECRHVVEGLLSCIWYGEISDDTKQSYSRIRKIVARRLTEEGQPTIK